MEETEPIGTIQGSTMQLIGLDKFKKNHVVEVSPVVDEKREFTEVQVLEERKHVQVLPMSHLTILHQVFCDLWS